jgi:hypothetical protein
MELWGFMLTTHLHLAPRLIKRIYTSTPLHAFEMWTGKILHIIFMFSVFRFNSYIFVILLRATIYYSYMQCNCPIVNSDLLGCVAVLLAPAMQQQQQKKLLGA